MIHAYNESYLNTVMRNIAGMFDLAINVHKLDPDKFALKFSESEVAHGIETGSPNMLAGKSSAELFAIVSGQYSTSCIVAMNRSPEYWAGWVLAMAQWSLNVPFRSILQVMPLSALIRMYYPYHEADERKTIEIIESRLPKKDSPLKQQRKKSGLTQEQLAFLSEVNIRSIRSYEQGDNELIKAQGETLLRLAKALGCSIEDLLKV